MNIENAIAVLTLWVAPPEMFYSWYRDLMEPKPIVELHTF